MQADYLESWLPSIINQGKIKILIMRTATAIATQSPTYLMTIAKELYYHDKHLK
jgi:hypothetical protein